MSDLNTISALILTPDRHRAFPHARLTLAHRWSTRSVSVAHMDLQRPVSDRRKHRVASRHAKRAITSHIEIYTHENHRYPALASVIVWHAEEQDFGQLHWESYKEGRIGLTCSYWPNDACRWMAPYALLMIPVDSYCCPFQYIDMRN